MEAVPLDPGIFPHFQRPPRCGVRHKSMSAFRRVKLRVHVQGNCTRISVKDFDLEYIPNFKRGAIGKMSAGSRLNLLRFLNRVDWEAMSPVSFVTLTYPDSVLHRDYSLRSMDRSRFARGLERTAGHHVPIVWRVEWKPRLSGEFIGRIMPHWHLLVCKEKGYTNERIRKIWQGVLGLGLGFVSVNVKEVDGVLGAVRYVAKYLSLQKTLDINTYHNSGFSFGRHWGILRKGLFVSCPVRVDRYLTSAEVESVEAWAVANGKTWNLEQEAGWTVFSGEAADYFSSLDKCS